MLCDDEPDDDGATSPVFPREDQLRVTALSMAVQSSRNDDSPERVARRAQTFYAFLKGEQPA